jgi:hypothetical protein
MVDFSDFREARLWLEGHPRTVSVTIASRAALRVLPLIVMGQGRRRRNNFSSKIVLPVFRATAVTWAVAKFPARSRKLRTSVRASTHADAAYADTDTSADAAAANSAAYAAYAANTSTSAAADAVQAIDLAAAAAHAAAAIAGVATASAAAADADFIETGVLAAPGISASELAGAPLWLDVAIPGEIADCWTRLKEALSTAAEGWEVWIDWYEDRLRGQTRLSP